MGKGFSNYRKSVLGGGGGGMAGMGNMQALREQALKMQQEIEEAQDKIANAEFEGQSGGGAVKVIMTGEKKITGVKLSPEMVDPDDIEMLEDLIVAAANDGYAKAERFAKEVMPNGADGLF